MQPGVKSLCLRENPSHIITIFPPHHFQQIPSSSCGVSLLDHGAPGGDVRAAAAPPQVDHHQPVAHHRRVRPSPSPRRGSVHANVLVILLLLSFLPHPAAAVAVLAEAVAVGHAVAAVVAVAARCGDADAVAASVVAANPCAAGLEGGFLGDSQAVAQLWRRVVTGVLWKGILK